MAYFIHEHILCQARPRMHEWTFSVVSYEYEVCYFHIRDVRVNKKTHECPLGRGRETYQRISRKWMHHPLCWVQGCRETRRRLETF